MPHVIAFDVDLLARPAADPPSSLDVLAAMARMRLPFRVLAYTRHPGALLARGAATETVVPVGVPARGRPAAGLAMAARLRTDRPTFLHCAAPPPQYVECPVVLSPGEDILGGRGARAGRGGAPERVERLMLRARRILVEAPSDVALLHDWLPSLPFQRVTVLPRRERRASDVAAALAEVYTELLRELQGVGSEHPAPRSVPGLVVASVVSTGEAERLQSCLAGVAGQGGGVNIRTVVVCNQQGDGSAEAARRYAPQALVLEQRLRRGFARNHNEAQAAVPAEFGLILNPDVVLEPGCVAALIDVMRQKPQCGVAAPLLVYPNDRPQPSARRFPEPFGTLLRRTPLRRVLAPRRFNRRHFLPPPTELRRVDWALGACLLVRRAAWEEVGGFDPEFEPLYVEDIDLGWRMWQRGWEVWQTPTARAVHEHQAVTDGAFLQRRTLWHVHGMRHFVRKHPTVLAAYRPALCSAVGGAAPSSGAEARP